MTAFEGLTAGTWTLDPAHSEVAFTVRHAGISKVRGIFEQTEAELHAGETAQDSSVRATVQIASINTKNEGRDGHVKGPEFFDAENHPQMVFESTEITADGEDLTLVGNLTIKGETRPVTFTGEFGGVAVDPFGTTRAGFSASTTISRKDFGITWNAALEAGGVMVSDKVKIEIDAEFTAPQN
ncbi:MULTISPECIES: YceI family protein [Rothia]|uniref:Polyisoprenoid-binding protein n=1 Tax=Rothia kristinae TaxID=37923 RepID=A0A199NTN7_9MICC|nr:YceI family protein [Rothia kristinae]MCT1357969.1 YceI family protein [Rothia kristinae]MCT1393868.1 YceI family protein [Rothia kristinae]MCT1506841.1 YceI family protein [Rothia kristinae]MCT2037784.1 YceI family protein [Rothia kristinae]MCT2243923.1 YceI family protein [Rothia kristinae]